MRFSTFISNAWQLTEKVDFIDFFSGAVRSRVSADPLTVNHTVQLPAKNGTIAVSEYISTFTSVVPFQGDTAFNTFTVVGPIDFTLGSATRSPNAKTLYRLIANGANVPTFAAQFTQTHDSANYTNISGFLNLIEFTWDAIGSWYKVIRPPLPTVPLWTDAVFQNGFTSLLNYQKMQYSLFNGQVYLRGIGQKAWPIGSSSSTIFTLPPGLRPVADIILPGPGVWQGVDSQFRIDALATGDVRLVSTASQTTGIAYPALCCSFWPS